MQASHREAREHLRAVSRRLAERIPDTYNAFGKLHHAALADGALSRKTKELIALGIAICSNCEGCIDHHVHAALKAGATAEEITEAIGVAILMAGGPATVYGAAAFEALEEFSAEAG